MKYSDIRKLDTLNGEGIGTSIFFSGCNFNCKGCFNKEAQNFNYGKDFTLEVENKFIEYAKNCHVSHISILGGEPFHQDLNIILNLVKRIKEEVGKPIFIWTGFKFEELLKDEIKLKILKYIDIITDGRFEVDKKEMDLYFKGSTNQRTIDVQQSLANNKIILKNDKKVFL